METNKNRVVVTVVGKYKKGIIAAVASALTEKEVNILDISQTILQEFFTMIMIVDMADATVGFSELREERYLVLNEYKKTSVTILEKLNKNNIKHCYMNDFAQDIIQKFKNDVKKPHD